MRLLIPALLALLPSPATAWWDYGHQTIARIAWLQVKPATRTRMQALFARQTALETPRCPVRTIEEASVWPDCVKPGERFSYAFSWHFQNIDLCKPFDLKAACPFGNCVSAQITRNAKLLADRSVPDRERLQAIAFLVHLVGDLHQPLHAADRSDQGGNKTRTRYGEAGPYPLHMIWDGYLAERSITSPAAEAAGLLREASHEDRAAISGTVEDWSREGWATARAIAYGTDPCSEPRPAVQLQRAEIEAAMPVVRRQVLRAGLRLARMLDEALSPTTGP